MYWFFIVPHVDIELEDNKQFISNIPRILKSKFFYNYVFVLGTKCLSYYTCQITKTYLYNFEPLKSHFYIAKKVREKSRECHNHKPQPFPDPKRKRRSTNLNKHKPNKRTKSTKISSLSSPSEVIAILKGLKNTRTK